jgi:hypothetical protein
MPDRRPSLLQRLSPGQQLFLALFLLAMMVLAEFWPHVAPGGRPRPSDFLIFRMVGRLFWQGNVADAYDFKTFLEIQKAMLGSDEPMLFGYPPPYILLLAPLGLARDGVDYLLFFAPALLIYGWCLMRLAGARAGLAVLMAWLPIFVTLVSGQNGLLTGALLGLACVGLLSRRAWAGVPLGLMIIKPQLALGLGLYVLVRREWLTLGVAAATALAALALATLVLGMAIWPAFLAGVREQGGLLAQGFFPLYRMVSPFALALSLDWPTAIASGLHITAAIAAGVVILFAGLRLPARAALGIALVASPQLSPYMMDYDLPLMAIGMALLLPPAGGQTRIGAHHLGAHHWAMVACLVFTCINGLVQIGRSDEMTAAQWPPAWGAVAMLAAFWLAALPLMGQVLRQGRRAQ